MKRIHNLDRIMRVGNMLKHDFLKEITNQNIRKEFKNRLKQEIEEHNKRRQELSVLYHKDCIDNESIKDKKMGDFCND